MTRRSRTIWIALTLLALLLGLALLYITRPNSRPGPITAATPAAAASQLKPPPAIPAPTQRLTPTAASTSAQSDDLCGVPPALQLRHKDETLGQHVERVTRPTLDRWHQALADSASPRLQAIGLALADASLDLTSELNEAPDTEAHNQLVLRALDGTDPAIYALALGSCHAFWRPMPPGSCQGLSYEHWAQMDSSNAIPWLLLAVRSADDPAKAQEALQKAADAPRYESYLDAINSEPLALLPAGSSDLDRVVAAAELMAISRVGEPILFGSVCSDEAMAQPERRQVCDAVARRYAKESKSLLGPAIAAVAGRRLGWPQDQVDALEDEKQRAMEAIQQYNGQSDDERYRCEKVHRRARYFSLLEAAGGSERAAFRQYTATAGHP